MRKSVYLVALVLLAACVPPPPPPPTPYIGGQAPLVATWDGQPFCAYIGAQLAQRFAVRQPAQRLQDHDRGDHPAGDRRAAPTGGKQIGEEHLGEQAAAMLGQEPLHRPSGDQMAAQRRGVQQLRVQLARSQHPTSLFDPHPQHGDPHIAWKVAAGLSLTEEGFDPTVLVYWRNRLRASGRPERIFDAVREVVAECGVLASRTARVLDSTVLDDAVLRQDTVMQLAAQLRKTARLIPHVTGLALSGPSAETSGKPICDWDDPVDVERLVSRLVNTAVEVVEAVDGVELTDEQADAIGLLWLLCGQDVEPGARPGTWRIAEGTARDRMVSVHDPDARHVHKTTHDYRDGYKAHVAVEPETGIITAATLTAGNVPDAQAAPDLLATEPEPRQVFGDSAYGTGELRQQLAEAGHTTVIKPPMLRSAIPGGFNLDDFDIDTAAGTVTCPAGHVVTIRSSGTASFARHCQRCPLRRRCTTARAGRVIKIHPDHDRLHAARRQAEDPEFWAAYTMTRPMGERTISWLVADGCRKVRYRRLERNRHWLRLRCAVLNLKRLITLGLSHDSVRWTLIAT